MNRIKIAEHPNELNFGLNNIALVEIPGRKICVGKFQDRLFGFAPKCPHAGGSLADGFIDARGHVVCPLHRYRFSMENGRNVSGEGYFLKHWEVEWTEEGIFVTVDEKLF